MKRKIVTGMFLMMMSVSLLACSASLDSEDSSTTGEATETVEASSEYSELTIKTDWESMATIIFSDSTMAIDGSGCSDEDGVLYITEGGAYTITGTSSDACIVVDTDENVKIILNGVDLTNDDGPVIYGANVKNLYIELADDTTNYLTDGSTYVTDSSTGEEIGKGVISCEDDIIILGSGSLNITANHQHGIVSDDKLYIEDGTIDITSYGTDGIHANDLVCIDGGTINVTAPSDIMESEDMLVINGGTITGTSDDEGIEAKGSLYINGGNIDIAVADDGLNAGTYIEINGGTMYVTCTNGDAIDCNGNYDGCIVINGGLVYAMGGGTPEGGIDADNSSVIINGGIVIAIGDVNSPIDESGSQVTVVYGSFSAGDTIGILDSDGNTVFAIEPTVSGNTMIISTANLTSGETYTIYTGGTIEGDSDEYGYYENGTYSGGTSALEFTVDSQVVEAGGSDEGMGGMGGGPGGDMGGGPGMNSDEEMPSRGQAPDDGDFGKGGGKGMPQDNGDGPGSADSDSSDSSQ